MSNGKSNYNSNSSKDRAKSKDQLFNTLPSCQSKNRESENFNSSRNKENLFSSANQVVNIGNIVDQIKGEASMGKKQGNL